MSFLRPQQWSLVYLDAGVVWLLDFAVLVLHVKFVGLDLLVPRSRVLWWDGRRQGAVSKSEGNGTVSGPCPIRVSISRTATVVTCVGTITPAVP